MDALIGIILIGGLFVFLLWPVRYASHQNVSRSRANKAAAYNQMVAIKQMTDWPNVNAADQLNGCRCFTCQGIRSAYDGKSPFQGK